MNDDERESIIPEDDDYIPADRPASETSKRVRFEREGGVEQAIFGGSAKDVESAILGNTAISTRVIGKRIKGVGTERADLGGGSMSQLSIHFSDGGYLNITGDNLEVEIG